MVYILAEIVTKHIKQQLICDFTLKIFAKSTLSAGVFTLNSDDKQAVTRGRKKQIGFASPRTSQQNSANMQA
ncbi:hypothetical protein LU604_23480 [Erwinia tracheiphila]|uniref:Uncharacterized protein n=1 Tax=Erwinia tracheiphila TaxID=65700 RepID=A0A345CX48_9GAMM|nr:hypothetical protein [Erwinia tracheiphila]AXF78015.1 hypothetical protein AV903_21660 [Erwinia tracheiphila]UIA83269.1 hypothetical protein LU604_23480 [Erwinia tracheiphila]UIA91848.1 hypothetical protein LU632_22945 [Erwinia tracheiphila]